MFGRRIEKELENWANDPYRKLLVLRGARQVGKTTIVNRFAEKFENYLSINLEKSDALRLFESTDNVKELLPLPEVHVIAAGSLLETMLDVLFNGFQKKSEKAPKREIEKALK